MKRLLFVALLAGCSTQASDIGDSVRAALPDPDTASFGDAVIAEGVACGTVTTKATGHRQFMVRDGQVRFSGADRMGFLTCCHGLAAKAEGREIPDAVAACGRLD